MRAKRARCSAAWPAEFAAPTMYTSSPSRVRRVARRRAVEHAATGERRQSRSPRSSRYDTPVATSTALASISVPSSKRTAWTEPRCSSADDAAGEHHLGAEPARLRRRAVREVRAAQPVREAEVVLDAGALAGLPARCVAFDDGGVQPFRRAVDRGRQPGRAGADDDEVVERRLAPSSGARGRRRSRARSRRAGRCRRSGAPAGVRRRCRRTARSSRRASASRSSSSHWYGTWLRARNIRVS